MMEADRFDKEAAELVSCLYLSCDHVEFRRHINVCPANYRPAVAARLRKDGAEIERLKLMERSGLQLANSLITELQAEVANLRAQLAALHGKIMNLEVDEAHSANFSYKLGHSYARRAAAELCVTLLYDAKEAIRAAMTESEVKR